MTRLNFDVQVRTAIYRHFAETGSAPALPDVAAAVGAEPRAVGESYQRLSQKRMLVLMPDGEAIRMAPPFSGIETQHRVLANGREYFANCAWDSFGIPAALHADADVVSRCEQTHEPLRLRVSHRQRQTDCTAERAATIAPTNVREIAPTTVSEWFFHVAVPAAHWWRDIVYT